MGYLLCHEAVFHTPDQAYLNLHVPLQDGTVLSVRALLQYVWGWDLAVVKAKIALWRTGKSFQVMFAWNGASGYPYSVTGALWPPRPMTEGDGIQVIDGIKFMAWVRQVRRDFVERELTRADV